MTSVLITQCLQRDFVGPIGGHEPLPNTLHVGYGEALRLMGHDPAHGPVAQLMRWARAQSGLEIVHIRDWHDPDDPGQRDHLATFGTHCVRDTPGAELVLGMDRDLGSHEHLVNAIALNDFEGTTLADTLGRIRDEHGELRIGVIGVWTEAKVSFLLYDLKTRFGIDALATCSALTASSSRQQHFIALEQVRKILGVTVCDSVAGFANWLRPGARLELPAAASGLRARITHTGAAPIGDLDSSIVGHLFRDSASVTLHPLAGGFSGATVFRSVSQDVLGRQQAPTVVKLGPPDLIGKERAAFERVEEILGNSAPAMRGFVDVGERAGIKYAFAAMGQGSVRTLKAIWEAGLPIDDVLRRVFDEVLDPFYAAARYEPLPLLDYYEFRTYAKGARARAMAVGDGAVLGRFYEEVLPTLVSQPGESHYVCTAHGDLNTANVLVDARDNVWVIDFFHTASGHHVLRDVAKLENDLLYILTPLGSEAELAEAITLTDALAAVEDLAAPLPDLALASPALQRTWSTLRTLRRLTARLCREDRHPLQLTIALLRYAVHTLGFDESSPLQRRWALAAATRWAVEIETDMKADHTLRVDWLEGLPGLGMTLCPGRRDRGRNLGADLDALRHQDTRHLLCLLSDEELESVGVTGLRTATAARGIELWQVPIRDQGVPTLEEADRIMVGILAALERGEKVVTHCMGGLGRTGTIAACALVARGADPAEAIAMVRRSREPRAVESPAQERFVTAFAGRRSATPGGLRGSLGNVP